MDGLDERVVSAHRQALGIRQGHLEVGGQLVHSHHPLSQMTFRVLGEV